MNEIRFATLLFQLRNRFNENSDIFSLNRYEEPSNTFEVFVNNKSINPIDLSDENDVLLAELKAFSLDENILNDNTFVFFNLRSAEPHEVDSWIMEKLNSQ